MKHGMGTLTWDDGDMYIGEFENDEKTRGTFNWKGGDSYTGEWKNSLMHGYGTYTYRNGRKYEGQWDGGYKEGFGMLRGLAFATAHSMRSRNLYLAKR